MYRGERKSLQPLRLVIKTPSIHSPFPQNEKYGCPKESHPLVKKKDLNTLKNPIHESNIMKQFLAISYSKPNGFWLTWTQHKKWLGPNLIFNLSHHTLILN
mgnify:CR=1 FL=1